MRPYGVTILLTVFTLVASAHVIPKDPPRPDGNPRLASREVQPYPGGAPITRKGTTVEEVHAKLLEMNPNYDDNDWRDTDTPPEQPEPLVKRVKHDIVCKTPKGNAHKDSIWQGIEYLRGVGEKPHLPAKTCERVSCSYNSAIIWCNDASTFRVLPSWDNIADGASVIIKECATGYKDVMGILDHNDHWRVFVEKADC
ncbi:hypothetical protein BDW59DRAFT_160524 [Aspergillus cavernicola]|uniref:Secreted protein n=1 Tax=Aspergillus cavernicola TaxID=176166 RepID=A0ABR4IHK1_9EURO